MTWRNDPDSRHRHAAERTASACHGSIAWPDSLWDWHVHLPYQHGVRCGDLIFLGGQVSLDRQGRAVNPGDLSAQTHQAMAAYRHACWQSLGAEL